VTARRAKGDGSMFPVKGGYRGYVTTASGKRVYFTAKTKAEAGAKKRELTTARDNGELMPGTSPTVEQWMRHWLQTIADIRPTTRQTHEWVLAEKVAGNRLGMTQLTKLTPEHLEQWLRDLDVRPSSVRRYAAPVRTSLTVAVRRGHLRRNPFDLVALPKTEKSRSTAMSVEDADRVLAAAQGTRNAPRWHLALRFGLRPAEALGLTWADFDPVKRTLTVRHQLLYAKGAGIYLQDAAKTEAGTRTIKLPRYLVELLVQHRRAQAAEMAASDWTGWDFDGVPVALMFAQPNGRPILARMDTDQWKALLTAAGLPSDRRYVARHTAATHMIAMTGDIALTSRNLGHADTGFTYRTYVHPLQRAADDLADAMDAAPYAAPYGRGVQSAPEEDGAAPESDQVLEVSDWTTEAVGRITRNE